MTVKTALIQMTTEYDVEKNVQRAENHIREAASQGAKIVGLQELFNTIYFCYEMNPKHLELAEPIPGPTIERMQQIAKDEGIVLLAPIYEKAMQGELYNSAAVIGPDGEIIGVYRKSSIPLVNNPNLTGLEKYYFKPGNSGFQVFDTPFARIGILICYDRHFPEAARVLALRGAQFLFVPTATYGMSRYLWEIELRAHAIDNIFYVGGVNRVGRDTDGADADWYGSSMICDPKGQIMAQAGDKDDEIVYADLDFSVMDEIRNDWGFFRDRRPDLYGDLVK